MTDSPQNPPPRRSLTVFDAHLSRSRQVPSSSSRAEKVSIADVGTNVHLLWTRPPSHRHMPCLSTHASERLGLPDTDARPHYASVVLLRVALARHVCTCHFTGADSLSCTHAMPHSSGTTPGLLEMPGLVRVTGAVSLSGVRICCSPD